LRARLVHLPAGADPRRLHQLYPVFVWGAQ
jgi:hypothetical protein